MRYQNTIVLTAAHHLALEQQTLAIQPGQYLQLEPHGPVSRFVGYRPGYSDIVHRGTTGKTFARAFKQRRANHRPERITS